MMTKEKAIERVFDRCNPNDCIGRTEDQRRMQQPQTNPSNSAGIANTDPDT